MRCSKRTGSKRLQRVGDVDGWEGGRLAISAEVKQYALSIDDTRDLESFSNAIGQRVKFRKPGSKPTRQINRFDLVDRRGPLSPW
jgi:hypothetical protein